MIITSEEFQTRKLLIWINKSSDLHWTEHQRRFPQRAMFIDDWSNAIRQNDSISRLLMRFTDVKVDFWNSFNRLFNQLDAKTKCSTSESPALFIIINRNKWHCSQFAQHENRINQLKPRATLNKAENMTKTTIKINRQTAKILKMFEMILSKAICRCANDFMIFKTFCIANHVRRTIQLILMERNTETQTSIVHCTLDASDFQLKWFKTNKHAV